MNKKLVYTAFAFSILWNSSCSDHHKQRDVIDYKTKYHELQEQIKLKNYTNGFGDSIKNFYPGKLFFKTHDSTLILSKTFLPGPDDALSLTVLNRHGHEIEFVYFNSNLKIIHLYKNHPIDLLFNGDELTYNEEFSTYYWRPELVFEYYSNFFEDNTNRAKKFAFRNPEFHFPTHIGNALYFDTLNQLDSITITTKDRKTSNVYKLDRKKPTLWRN